MCCAWFCGLQKRVPLEQWAQLHDKMKAIPVELDEEGRVQRVVAATNEWFDKAREMLDAKDGAQHVVVFEDLESHIAKAGGRTVALINSKVQELKDLNAMVHIGRTWSINVTAALNSLRVMGTGGRNSAESRKTREASIGKLREYLDAYNSPVLGQKGVVNTLPRLKIKLAQRLESRLNEVNPVLPDCAFASGLMFSFWVWFPGDCQHRDGVGCAARPGADDP